MKTKTHDIVCRTLTSLASVALLRPRREVMCLNDPDRNLRMDIVVPISTSTDEKEELIDVAVTSPFTNPAEAKKTPGGAATDYEKKKTVQI